MARDPIGTAEFGPRPLDLSRRGVLALGAAGLITSRAAWAQTGGATGGAPPTKADRPGGDRAVAGTDGVQSADDLDRGRSGRVVEPL